MSDVSMTANSLTPFEPTHPGSILKSEIEFRGISQKDFAATVGFAPTALNEILNGKRQLTERTALMICAALKISPEPLIRMQSDYNLQMARRDKSFLEKLAAISRRVAAL